MKNNRETLHFRDGVTRIDFILAYTDEFHDDDDEPDDEEAETLASMRQKRASFQHNLKSQGLLLELEPASDSMDGKTNFLKLSAPWALLKKYGEILNLKMPIKVI